MVFPVDETLARVLYVKDPTMKNGIDKGRTGALMPRLSLAVFFVGAKRFDVLRPRTLNTARHQFITLMDGQGIFNDRWEGKNSAPENRLYHFKLI